MISWRMRLARGDRGATLLLVLILMSVTSIVLSVVLAQADTAERSTIQLRDQAADAYGADGAMQAVLNSLKKSGLSCNTPTTTASATLGGTSSASAFYAPGSSEQGPINAYAECTSDPINGKTTSVSVSQPPPSTIVRTITPSPSGTGVSIGLTNQPTDAILTVGTGTSASEGQAYSGNNTICIEGGSVRSNSTISTDKGSSTATLAVGAAGSAAAGSCGTGAPLTVAAVGTCSGSFSPTPCTHFTPAQVTPSAPTPTGATTLDQDPVCQVGSDGKTYAAYLPGKYTRLSSSNKSSLSTPCKIKGSWVSADVDWFTPGTYFFDYGGQWSVPATVIGGTPTTPGGVKIANLNGASAATLAASTLSNLAQATAFPGACASPAVQNNFGGIEFVFGGASTLSMGAGNNFDICATYVDPTSCSTQSCAVPIALYGNPASGNGTSTNAVTTQSSSGACFATPGCSNGTMITTDNQGKSTFHIEGYVYAPEARFELTFKNNSSGQVFNWGLLVRAFNITVNGTSCNPSCVPFVQLQGNNVGIITPTPYPSTSISIPAPVSSTITQYTIRYINVWTCTVASLRASGLASCPKSGPPTAQAKVLTDVNGVPVKILSWTHVA